MKKWLIKGLIGALLGALLIVVGFFAILTVFNPKHEPIEALTLTNNAKQIASHTEAFSVMTFNIGYAGLDDTQDFFADGGKRSRAPSQEQVLSNLEAMTAFMSDVSPDFIMVQEIDRKASRSHDVEQYTFIKEGLDGYGSTFAYNYNALWVPVPIFSPMGYANAGLGTFSKYQLSEANRIALNGQESWPMILAELDRCFTENFVPLDNGMSLVLINLHLSAYDKGGLLRAAQAAHVYTHMNALYEAGHYVILGGDWNQLLSDAQLSDPSFLENWPEWLVKIPETLTDSGFVWALDESVMTVRDLATPYEKGVTFETIIDGFLVSPNVEVLNVRGFDLSFKHSDHNPVWLDFKLK